MKINTMRLYFANRLMHIIPETRCFGIKRTLLRFSGISVGANVRVCSSVSFFGSGRISIGDDTFIGHKTLIIASSNVIIGACCDISSNVTILNGSHEIDLGGEHIAGKGKSEDVHIGDGSWICANATILGGTHIGNKSIVAASATTKGLYPGNSIIRGCIAKYSPIVSEIERSN